MPFQPRPMGTELGPDGRCTGERPACTISAWHRLRRLSPSPSKCTKPTAALSFFSVTRPSRRRRYRPTTTVGFRCSSRGGSGLDVRNHKPRRRRSGWKRAGDSSGPVGRGVRRETRRASSYRACRPLSRLQPERRGGRASCRVGSGATKIVRIHPSHSRTRCPYGLPRSADNYQTDPQAGRRGVVQPERHGPLDRARQRQRKCGGGFVGRLARSLCGVATPIGRTRSGSSSVSMGLVTAQARSRQRSSSPIYSASV